MSNLSSKRAQAPEPVKNIDLKPTASDEAKVSPVKVVEMPADKEDATPEVKVITDETDQQPNEEAKTEKSSQKDEVVQIENEKKELVDEPKKSQDVTNEEKLAEEATVQKEVE